MTTLTTPIVGSNFRQFAQPILQILPLGTSLILEPEPDNPWDPAAIKVLVALRATYPISKWVQLNEALEGTGMDASSIMEREKVEGPLHLGYIPKSGAKTCKGGPGNLEVARAIAGLDRMGYSSDRLFHAILSTAPEGYPTVTITIIEAPPNA